ncbi:MAG: tetratricopeptide repeat protein [Bacteroidales bacterium]|nr:tetratricopeptide repeat protein [Bacteroidales bacterium]
MRLILAAVLLSFTVYAAPDERTEIYRQAVNLYNHGMYERAATLLDKIPGNPMSDGYALLCAIKMQSPGFEQRLAQYEKDWRKSSISNLIDYEYALVLFDRGRYSEAADRFACVERKYLDESTWQELAFKTGYAFFNRGLYSEARGPFYEVEALPMSDYKAPSRYALGYMSYCEKDFPTAQKWFELSATDPRFAALSAFYLVDCHFMQKDYDYTIREGEAIYANEPGVRQAHLARIISESYLVKGDSQKAKEYYSATSKENMTRADWFYAGSVLYAVEDYKGAIANYTKMTNRADSLGQIANYQLANAYLNTGNKIAAMGAFKDASDVAWNGVMQEDALFNYAKLAFDLNKDTEPFGRYIDTYSTSRRGDEIYSYMALASLYNRDYAGAVEAYDKIDELSPGQQRNYIKAYYLRGEQLIASGSYTDAIPCLRAAAYYLPKQDPLGQMARYWQAEANYRAENYDDAARLFADLYNISALEGMMEGELLSYNTAYSHMKAGDYAPAIRWFDIYLSEGNAVARKDAVVRRGDCYFASRDYAGAITAYRAAIKEIPVKEDIYPYSQLALSYGLTGDKNAKADVLAYVLHADPNTPMYAEGLYELGRANMDISDNTKALEAFTILRDAAPDRETRAKALIGIGMVCRNTHDYNASLAAYKEVVELLPGSEEAEDALFAIESIYQTIGQPEKYLEYVESNNLTAGKTDSDKEQLYFNAAEQIFLAGNYVQAASSLQKYLDTYPYGINRTKAYFYLAESYNALGGKEKACDFYEKVIAASDAGSFAESSMLHLADLSYSLERYMKAYSSYKDLRDHAVMEQNRTIALWGMMRSAFRARSWADAISASDAVSGQSGLSKEEKRECNYVLAKSYMATSRRDEALAVFKILSSEPATAEGAEARYILIQDAFDRASYTEVQQGVFDFSDKAGGQNYWLARAYITLADTFVQLGKNDQAKATLESIRDGYTPERADDDIQDLVQSRLYKL